MTNKYEESAQQLPKLGPWGLLYPKSYARFSVKHLHGRKEITFGRDETDVIFEKDGLTTVDFQSISKSHFMIKKDEDNKVFITDLSVNGTFVNGKRIENGIKHELHHHNEIGICRRDLIVYIFHKLS